MAMTIPSQRVGSPATDRQAGGGDRARARARSGPAPRVAAVGVARRAGMSLVRRYHRLDITVDEPVPDTSVLFVTNHGFGGFADLNVIAALTALDGLSLTRDVTILCHQLAWTLGCGMIVEAAGARPASRESAAEAFGLGHHVLVAPGGDIEAAKPFPDRNRIVFDGRRGFARLAIDNGVPIVPIVTAGTGESLLVLSDGQRLARVLRLDRIARLKVAPVTVSVPWGLTVGVPALLPYLPLPTKLTTEVLPALRPDHGESPQAFGDRVEAAMQEALTRMTAHRRLLLG